MKKNVFFFFFLLVAMIRLEAFAQQNVWDGKVAESFESGDGSEASPFEISTPQQLALLASEVNNGNSYSGKYFVITADMDLGGEQGMNWIPVGYRYNKSFEGFLDGGYRTISGMSIRVGEFDKIEAVGLFGNLGSASRLTGFVVYGDISSEHKSAGGIAGSNAGMIESCFSFVDITTKEQGWIGGVCGRNGGTIRSSIFCGRLSGGFNQGGIVGSNTGNGVIEECINSGLIQGNYELISIHAGGIAGLNSGTIRNSVNYGSVYSYVNVGGIAGTASGDNQEMTDCINAGAVYGTGLVGAVLGFGEGTSNLHYDIRTASGLLTGDAYFDSKENSRLLTEQLIDGDSGVCSLSEPDKWVWIKGCYPQLKVFAESDFEMARKLSALAAVPVVVEGNLVLSSSKNGFSVDGKTSDGKGNTYDLTWTSEVPDILDFSGSAADFKAPGKDTDIVFNVGIEGTDFRKTFKYPYYAMYETVEVPAYRTENGKKVYEMSGFGNFAWVNGLVNGMIIGFAGDDAMPTNLAFKDCVLEMKNDIDFSGYNWIPIAGACGSALRFFAGKLDGKGHAIKNLFIDRPREDNVGLFGFIADNGSGVENLSLEGGSVTGSESNTGAFAGSVYLSDFRNCHNVSCKVSGRFFGGGLFGTVSGSEITMCSNMADVDMSYHGTGGLVGSLGSDNNKYTVLEQCYNKGNLSAEKGWMGGIAALVGTYSIVKDCYNMGSLTADNDMMGGIAGSASVDSNISDCYNAGAVMKPVGFIGKLRIGEILGELSSQYFTNNYYDKTTGKIGGGVGEIDVIGVEGLPTEEMVDNQDFITMLGEDVWELDSKDANGGYPVLKWENMPPVGIDEAGSSSTGMLVLYPNPCIDVVYVDNADVCDITVYDCGGHAVVRESGEGISSINLSGIESGLYIVVAKTDEGKVLTCKINRK